MNISEVFWLQIKPGYDMKNKKAEIQKLTGFIPLKKSKWLSGGTNRFCANLCSPDWILYYETSSWWRFFIFIQSWNSPLWNVGSNFVLKCYVIHYGIHEHWHGNTWNLLNLDPIRIHLHSVSMTSKLAFGGMRVILYG